MSLLRLLDLHPDLFYKYHSSTSKEDACHRGDGTAGRLGAETTDCDSPISLINETFKWIGKHIKDDVDFVIWTGDSARHDNDENIPRTEEQIVNTNELLVSKFVETFGKEDHINDTDPTNGFVIPIIPTFGNNDIMPHNIMDQGPNKWTKEYLRIWKQMIPEEQRHGFEKGGWFFVEVIPNKLAVFSLNTLYFFDSNTIVDGCDAKSEPGYQQMEWLRIQLQFLRQRGLKAILMGHVPPARTESKTSWDESCWQKYTLWMHQYRDVVVGSLFGHMNIDHFMLQDSRDIDILDSIPSSLKPSRIPLEDELTIQSSAEYLTELRIGWSRLPDPPRVKKLLSGASTQDGERPNIRNKHQKDKGKKDHQTKEEKFYEKIGGPWGERYSLSLVNPSIVPNYFPTIRVIEYNITGIDTIPAIPFKDQHGDEHPVAFVDTPSFDETEPEYASEPLAEMASYGKRNGRKGERSKKPNFKTPKSPSESSPPGPAYSPQTLTWLGYTEYFANLTAINNDFNSDTVSSPEGGLVEDEGWKHGKHHGERPHNEDPKLPLKKFKFEVEYNTRSDKIYNMTDLTVRSYIDLATRIGQYKPRKGDRILPTAVEREATGVCGYLEDEDGNFSGNEDDTDVVDVIKKKKKDQKHKKKKHGKHQKRKAINKPWLTFVRRAFVGTKDDEDLHDSFGQL